MEVVHLLFAYGRDLTELQMRCTAIVLILSTITFIHNAGLRIVCHNMLLTYDRYYVMCGS